MERDAKINEVLKAMTVEKKDGTYWVSHWFQLKYAMDKAMEVDGPLVDTEEPKWLNDTDFVRCMVTEEAPNEFDFTAMLYLNNEMAGVVFQFKHQAL